MVTTKKIGKNRQKWKWEVYQNNILEKADQTQKKTVMEKMNNKKDMTYKRKSKMAEISSFLAVTTNANRLNSSVKTQILTEWIKNIIQLYAVCKRFSLDSRHK